MASGFRVDIQFLRGVAVLLVLLYHAKLAGLEAGYLGVDVFFVISGFLITGIVGRAIREGRFSFYEFYLNRAKRLLPPSLVVIMCVGLVAPFILARAEYEDLIAQIVGSITFTANIALWLQSGYFGSDAALKPLLHMWSLGIEEQYYLLLPLTMFVTPRRFWIPVAVVLAALSLAACLYVVPRAPAAAFYLLPTRAWELALGSLGFLALRFESARVLRGLVWPALAILFVVPVTSIDGRHPGLAAALVCCATLTIILARSPSLNASLPAKAIAKVGDLSYSLYLVHWPLFAFANNIYLAGVPVEVRVVLIFSSFILAYVLYRFVEAPVRRTQLKRPLYAATAVATLAILAILTPLGLASAMGTTTAALSGRESNKGFSGSCELNPPYRPKPECQNADLPRIMVWGDSYAMHVVDGIAATTDAGVIQATKSTCGPFLDLAVVSESRSETWARKCIGFNRSVFDYLSQAPSIEVVVLASPFWQFVLSGLENLQAAGKDFRRVPATEERALSSLQTTADALRRIGKRVVVIAPPPSSGDFDVGLCVDRLRAHKPMIGVPADCSISKARYLDEKSGINAFLDAAEAKGIVPVIRLDSAICGDTTCAAVIGDVSIFVDKGHLTHEGSKLVGRRIGLGEKVLSEAR